MTTEDLLLLVLALFFGASCLIAVASLIELEKEGERRAAEKIRRRFRRY